MLSRRRLIGMAPAIPMIGFFDFDKMPDFVPNTFAGFTPESGFSDLLKLDSHGPYLRFAWLDKKDGEHLPYVRAMIWAMETPGRMAVGVSTDDEYRTFNIARITDPHMSFPWQDDVTWTQREAITRLIRVLVRQENGLPVVFKEEK